MGIQEEKRNGGTVTNRRVQFSNSEGKGKRLWKKVKYQLVEYHSLPDYLRDDEYIKGHYRANWPLKEALFSIFSIHNETLNVWTHLIGFLLFLSLTIYTAMKVPKVVDLHSLQHLPDDLMADLYELREELKASLPSMHMLPSLWWHTLEVLSNCLPERFSSGNHADVCVLRSMTDLQTS